MERETDVGRIFAEAGERFGYRHVDATFVKCSELKIKWTRQNRTVEFWVTDYLKDAPEEVLSSLANTIFSRLHEDADTPYDDSVIAYLESEDFIRENQPVYVSRLGCASASPVGMYKDLRRSVKSLVSEELIEGIPDNLYYGWLPVGLGDCAGHASGLMRSIVINTRLDRAEVDDEILDFCMYMQIVKMQQGSLLEGPRRMNSEYLKRVEEYPGSERLLSEIGKLGLSPWKALSPEC
ncbi:MAG: hypothetical protein E7Z64_05130 [Thermoplasmata archaeon]|nr:hypothetical protein [Thermoplasmata archaeon]